MLELYFVYNGHCKFFLGRFDNVDELIEQMEDHQWAFSAITHHYIEALNDLDGLVEASYREAIERFLEDEVR